MTSHKPIQIDPGSVRAAVADKRLHVCTITHLLHESSGIHSLTVILGETKGTSQLLHVCTINAHSPKKVLPAYKIYMKGGLGTIYTASRINY